MEKFTVRMSVEKETPNQIRFKEHTEEGKPPRLGSIYIPKWVVGDEQTIDVTVEKAADSARQPKQPKGK